MEFKDYYKIMGLSRDATQDDIKRAYRRLARKYHPDVSQEAEAEARFKEIGEAYEVLKDPERRAAYDRLGSQWQAGQEFHPPPDWDSGFAFSGGGFTDLGGFSDFFEALFGRARPGPAEFTSGAFRAPGRDQQARIEVVLEDAYHGAVRTISLRSTPEIDRHGQPHNQARSLNVKIPQGIMEGQRIRLAGQGGTGVGGGGRGDLYLEVVFRPHPHFRAVGRDIHLDLPITPWEAALGRSVTVPTLGGKVDIRIPAGSQSGRQLRLKGRGLPGNPPGDQYVRLMIQVPRADDALARDLYERMERHMPMNPRRALGV